MSVFVIIRSFQPGATFRDFDRTRFEIGLAAPLRTLLDTALQNVAGYIVVTCGEPNSMYGEEVREGLTPTSAAVRATFPSETASGRIVTIACKDWGLNAGSTRALNLCLPLAAERGATQVLVWSSEIRLDGGMLASMLAHRARHSLRLVGYCRSNWADRLQWKIPQHTCALWDLDLLQEIGGFNPDCDGDGVTMVYTDDFGDVPVAGMDEFEAYLRASRQHGVFVPWGMVGTRKPAFWDLSLKRPGTEEYRRNARKVARQALVMQAYARRIFPDLEFDEVIARMFRAGTND